MDKICTRCNFRNPQNRKVCQVCGYSKFFTTNETESVVAKQSDRVSMWDKLTTLVKESFARAEAAPMPAPPAHSGPTLEVCAPPVDPIILDDNDLDSMIAWFKSYGVDRPLILQQKNESKQVVVETNRAA